MMEVKYDILPQLFLRAPYYSFNSYDLERIPEVLSQQDFRNALWLASPMFYRLLEAQEFDFHRLNGAQKFTLYKYYNRMCFRPTPFGSFSSFSLLSWGNGETVRISKEGKLHLLPDMGLLVKFKNSKPINESELIGLNPTVYRLAGEFRYIKSLTKSNQGYEFRIEAIAAEQLNILMFSLLKKQSRSYRELRQWIIEKTECDDTEAVSLLDFMLEEQVLYCSNRGDLTAGEGIAMSVLPENVSIYWKGKIRTLPVPSTISLAAISKDISILLPETPKDENFQFFYGGLEKNIESGSLGEQDQTELLAACKFMHKLIQPSKSPALRQFITDFQARFDQRKVPLMLALDPDTGIPYGHSIIKSRENDLLDGIHFPESMQTDQQLNWTPAHRLLFSKWLEAQAEDQMAHINLYPEEIAGFDTNQSASPNTQAVIFSKTNEILQIEYAGSASATAILGRFSAFSNAITDCCRQLATIEVTANPEVAFADIGQFSSDHVDNINRREPIYPYTIPLNVYSNAKQANHLPPEDLLVYVRNGELFLESKKLSSRVIPRLSTAYNYNLNELSIFRLLCDMQYDGVKPIQHLDMASLFPGLDFYPRVVYGQTVLCAAKWVIREKAITELCDENRGDIQERIRHFRRSTGVPLLVSTGNYDQRLVFDLSSAKEAEFFLNFIKKSKAVTIHEFLRPSRIIKEGNKPLAGQFVALLYHEKPIYVPAQVTKRKINNKVARDFYLGGDWLYLKIYCTHHAADRLLQELIYPFVRKQSRGIASWFFIRYSDPESHLRLRFKTAEGNIGRLLSALRRQMRQQKFLTLIKDYQADTYRRELERYGHDLMDDAENLFYAGSELVCNNLFAKTINENNFSEFELALVSAYRLMSNFISEAEMTGFTLSVANSFLKEFNGGKELRTDMDTRYRQLRAKIENALNPAIKLPENLSVLLKKFNDVATITAKAAGYLDTGEKQQLLADLVHMQMNRTFADRQREQEFLVYYCLHKFVLSLNARKRKGEALV